MKHATLALIAIGLVVVSTIAEGQTPPTTPSTKGEPDLKTAEQKTAYALGLNIAKTLKNQDINLDTEVLLKGIRDGLNDKPGMTDKQVLEVLQAFEQKLMADRGAKMAALGEKNLKAGQAYLAENMSKPGVTTLPSGVQYKVLKSGTGKTPKATDTVVADYRGTFIDGTEFDAGKSEFSVDGVIKGWTEILQKMKVGDKWQVVIPSNLAYGPRGGQGIPPNTVLLFDMELIQVK